MGAAPLGARPRQQPQPLSRIQRREQCVERRAPGRVPDPESLAISAMRGMMINITAGVVANAASPPFAFAAMTQRSAIHLGNAEKCESTYGKSVVSAALEKAGHSIMYCRGGLVVQRSLTGEDPD